MIEDMIANGMAYGFLYAFMLYLSGCVPSLVYSFINAK